jgi:hypothetical protein
MKTVILSLLEDGSFKASLALDGRHVATIQGTRDLAKQAAELPGLAQFLDEVGLDQWPPSPNGVTWWLPSILRGMQIGWGFMTPWGVYLVGFGSLAAARSAIARLQGMWPALVRPPEALYEVFQTDGEGWGFFDRAGHLHATFATAAEAQELASKRKEGAV